jgi:hypothetical protein
MYNLSNVWLYYLKVVGSLSIQHSYSTGRIEMGEVSQNGVFEKCGTLEPLEEDEKKVT